MVRLLNDSLGAPGGGAGIVGVVAGVPLALGTLAGGGGPDGGPSGGAPTADISGPATAVVVGVVGAVGFA